MNYQLIDSSIRITEYNGLNSQVFNDQFEISICTEGSMLAVCNGMEKVMKTGDILIAFPYNIHSFLNCRGKRISITFPSRTSPISTYYAINPNYEFFLHNEEVLKWAKELYSLSVNGADFSIIFGYIHIIFGLIVPNLRLQKDKYEPDIFNRAIRYIHDNYTTPLTLESVAKYVGCTTAHLSRLFSSRIQGGFKYCLDFMRTEKAKRTIERGKYKIYEVCDMSGFSDQRTFNRTFKKMTGATPTQYKKQYKLEHKTIAII